MRPILTPLPPTIDLDRLRAFVSSQPLGFMLDSGPDGWQFIGFSPAWVLSSREDCCTLLRKGETQTFRGSPFAALRTALSAWDMPAEGLPPFWGGGVGFLSYDLGWQIERLGERPAPDLELPDMRWGFYEAVVAVSPQGEASLIVSSVPGSDPAELPERHAAWWARLHDLPPLPSARSFRATSRPMANLEPHAYYRALQQLRFHIEAGDLYQANFSQRFEWRGEGDVHAWYERLRRAHPAPYGAFLRQEEAIILSLSPERFLRLRQGQVETAPIKGTRPRGQTPELDERLAQELCASEKDRAEHLMIVDLERNDLGRVCRPGSVKVPERFVLEAHPTVWHLVSMVVGELASGRDRIDLLQATFPGGSITGAPKIRAMEVLNGLEPTRRGLYTGAIGYLGRDGAMDLNIAIRTALVVGDRVYLQVGGGIVADSDPESEYQETLDKAAAFFRTLETEAICVSS